MNPRRTVVSEMMDTAVLFAYIVDKSLVCLSKTMIIRNLDGNKKFLL